MYFPVSWLFTLGCQSIGTSASASVLPMNIQGWFLLGLTGLISLLSKEFSSFYYSTTVQKHQFFITPPSNGPTLTSVHDYWKDHSLDYTDLCCPLLLLPLIFPSTRVFSRGSALCIMWPKYWHFSSSISPSNEYSGLISFRMDWFDLLAVQGTLESLL